ncbi:MAG: putative S-layer protein [Clostridiales bacterium]|nr:putative S-layer protein [Clostridiales bacterium]
MRNKIKGLLTAVMALILVVSSMFTAYADSWKSEDGKHSNQLKQKSIQKQFKDVKEDFWAYKAIIELAKRGIIDGYPDETFKPDKSVTRSEFASLLTKSLKLTPTDNTQTFADVAPSSWDFNAVEASKKYLTGYQTSNGTLYFYGNQYAVREDMAVALVKALNIPKEADNGQLQQIFSDYNSISASLRDYVYTAYKAGIMVGSNNKFAPQNNLTRAEAATLLIRALQKTEKVPVDDNDTTKVPVDNTNNTNAILSNLTFNGTVVPGFNASTLAYNVVLPVGTTAIPVVAATYDASKATANVIQTTALPGYATVVVTALDGTAQKIYTINFTVATTALHTDATLSYLTFNGTVVPGFNAYTSAYNVVLPAGTTAIPVVVATVNDTGKATANVTQATGLPGIATIVVTAQDGITVKVYTVNFTVATIKSTDATLSNLTFNGTVVPGFNSYTSAYNVVLPAGTTAIPAVAATVHDTGKATVNVTQATGLPGYATIVVTAQDGITVKVYTINFTVAIAKSTDATLSNITINGTSIPSFNASTLAYNIILPAGSTAIPVVAATVNDTGKATANVIQSTGLPGYATIVVTAQDGITVRVYTVNFTIVQ